MWIPSSSFKKKKLKLIITEWDRCSWPSHDNHNWWISALCMYACMYVCMYVYLVSFYSYTSIYMHEYNIYNSWDRFTDSQFILRCWNMMSYRLGPRICFNATKSLRSVKDINTYSVDRGSNIPLRKLDTGNHQKKAAYVASVAYSSLIELSHSAIADCFPHLFVSTVKQNVMWYSLRNQLDNFLNIMLFLL